MGSLVPFLGRTSNRPRFEVVVATWQDQLVVILQQGGGKLGAKPGN